MTIDTKYLRELTAKTDIPWLAEFDMRLNNDEMILAVTAINALPALLDSHDRVILRETCFDYCRGKLIEAGHDCAAPLEAQVRSIIKIEQSLREQLAAANDETMKAQGAVGGGADDARWKPGTTAVDTLISERDAANAEVERLRDIAGKYIDAKSNMKSDLKYAEIFLTEAREKRDAANARADDLQKRLAKYEP